ncbi:MAG: RidA family protein [Rhodospirillaceae bacterium]|nr:RidA family protein [Rhodospirillaceae bacterium]
MINRPTISNALAGLLLSNALAGPAVAQSTDAASTNISRNPTGGYTQRSMEIPPGSRILFVSGQTATDADGNTPPDAKTQADIVYAKVGQTLRDAGMDWSDVVKTNLYMINPSDIGAVIKAGAMHNPGGKQAGTLVYVKALALPEVLIELEAVAARKD